jgi:hypothetical protein
MPYVGNRDGSFNGVRYAKDMVVAEGGPLSREDLEMLASEDYEKVRWEDEVSSEQLPEGVYIGDDGYAYDNPEDAGAEAEAKAIGGEGVITGAFEKGIEPGAPAVDSDEPNEEESSGEDSEE